MVRMGVGSYQNVYFPDLFLFQVAIYPGLTFTAVYKNGFPAGALYQYGISLADIDEMDPKVGRGRLAGKGQQEEE